MKCTRADELDSKATSSLPEWPKKNKRARVNHRDQAHPVALEGAGEATGAVSSAARSSEDVAETAAANARLRTPAAVDVRAANQSDQAAAAPVAINANASAADAAARNAANATQHAVKNGLDDTAAGMEACAATVAPTVAAASWSDTNTASVNEQVAAAAAGAEAAVAAAAAKTAEAERIAVEITNLKACETTSRAAAAAAQAAAQEAAANGVAAAKAAMEAATKAEAAGRVATEAAVNATALMSEAVDVGKAVAALVAEKAAKDADAAKAAAEADDARAAVAAVAVTYVLPHILGVLQRVEHTDATTRAWTQWAVAACRDSWEDLQHWTMLLLSLPAGELEFMKGVVALHTAELAAGELPMPTWQLRAQAGRHINQCVATHKHLAKLRRQLLVVNRGLLESALASINESESNPGVAVMQLAMDLLAEL